MDENNQQVKRPLENAFAFCLKILFWNVIALGILLIGGFFLLSQYVDIPTPVFWVNSIFVFLIAVSLELICPFLLVQKLVKPLGRLNEASNKLAWGEFDVNLDYTGTIKELDEVFENFGIMAEELAVTEHLRKEFVSNVSHEFKTPLSAIEGYATLLQSTDLTQEDCKDCTERILFNTHRLSDLVSNLLMLNKLDSNVLQPELKTYRLDEQILQILLQQENVWNTKNIEFDLDIDEITYHGAEMMLYHAWGNLISNAVKYSGDGGKIEVSLKRKRGEIVFTIRDHGIGITKENLPHIFEKFYQADNSRKSEGSGLGLAQVRGIMDLIGSHIAVDSEIGMGTTFTIVLPINKQSSKSSRLADW